MTAGFEVTEPASRTGAATGSHLRGDPFILESRGWSSETTDCAPKMIALASLVNLPAPDAVASVSYHSRGNLLIVAGDSGERARRCAARLCETLAVTLLDRVAVPAVGAFAEWRGQIDSVTGYLGEFTVNISELKAVDAPLTRGPIPARFDLILDFSAQPLFAMRQPPQGYFAAPADDTALEAVLLEVREAVGEFEKPKYFGYRENICAHSRSQKAGCSACIDVCSTQAISSDGDRVKVDPHLCMGCGACATVCPSGAMSYQFPRVPDRGAQIKQLLAAFRHAGGRDACVLFHNGGDGRALLQRAAELDQGLPGRALPLETLHVAAIGMDLLLPAIAFGASQVAILAAGSEDAEYLDALREQMGIAQAILTTLGFGTGHFALIESADPASLYRSFAALAPATSVGTPATFVLSNDKRTAIEFAVEHLVKQAPRQVEEIPLPPGAPFGEVRVDPSKCTMCMACVGSCPESALMDGVDQPLLKFLERNCVQCGLCENTCPEAAITLHPRLLLTPAVREARILNQTEPFHCVSCQKAFGTRQMVETMLGRLAGHSMFTGGAALRRLQMCADCRVIDMMSSKEEVSVLKL